LPSYKGRNTLESTLLRGVIGEVPGQEDTNIIGSTLELEMEEWPSWLKAAVLKNRNGHLLSS